MTELDIIVTQDADGNLYSNESILKGILHHTFFDGGYGDTGGGHIGKGARADVIRSLGFSDHPTEAECAAQMKSFKLDAYPEFTFTVHKSLVGEVQSIYKELKELGVKLNKGYQGSYCYRPIKNPNHKGSKILSMHSFGCAIDLNYNVNPFSKNPQIKKDDVIQGIVRSTNNPIVKVFAKYGWGWGGRYYDYMHFSKANGA